MRVKEVAERLDVGAGTIYALVAAGKLRCHRVGIGRGQLRFTEEHLAEYLASAEVGPRPAPATPKPGLVKSRHFHFP